MPEGGSLIKILELGLRIGGFVDDFAGMLTSFTGRWAPKRIYFGWVQVVLAALAMVATLPGRTQGLGLITEPLLRELGLSAVTYSQLNLWATLLGAGFALACGRLVDKWGSRWVLAGLATGLGLTVLMMSRVAGLGGLALALILTRGLGQSALSAVSIGLVGQWFRGRLSLAMAAFSILLSLGFMVAFPLVELAVQHRGWRWAWAAVGWTVLGLVPFLLIWGRRSPEAAGVKLEPALQDGADRLENETYDFSLRQALRTPAFWVVGLASALYLMVASGISLFNERILAQLGFERGLYINALVLTAFTGLGGNFLGGWLVARGSIRSLLAGALALLAGGLWALPRLQTPGAVFAQAGIMGVAGGVVMVIFFAFWRRHYGRKELGRIQGAAQALTVVGSAVGPLLLAQAFALSGSYSVVFRLLAVVVAAFAILAWLTPLPTTAPARR